ncbi:MAG: transcriptional regulator XRE family [Ignavibacteria bacterium]|nr:MAG: transcriptional regulator XRE family [Ignavibacteria bacterium]KAF0161475.1 MAG: transcriptional regulator XRE family [Ignavibacteria bacterium]
MASEALQKFAVELRTAREAKGISILQISTRTKIDPKFLTAIENAEFEILPEIYVRAFIKEFAQTVELNPKEIILKFDNAKSGISDTPPIVVKEPIAQTFTKNERLVTEKTEPEHKSVKHQNSIKPPSEFGATQYQHSVQMDKPQNGFMRANLNIVVGVLVLIAAMLVFYFAFFYDSTPEIIAYQPEQSLSDNTSRYEVKKPETPIVQDSLPSNTSTILTDSLRLKVQNREQVWIKVLSDGKIVQEGVVKKDSTLNFKALKQFRISIGNAGAVNLFFNDKPVKNIGKIGEIRSITITPDTIRYLTIKRNETKPASADR